MDNFPTFYRLERTNLRVEVPKTYAADYNHFITHMKSKGWNFSEILFRDFELSTTYGVRNTNSERNSHEAWDEDLSLYQYENLTQLLKNMYFKKALVDNNQASINLSASCSHFNDCHLNDQNFIQAEHDSNYNQISIPWIGSNYNKYKIVVLGINAYESGGIDDIRNNVTNSMIELSRNKYRVNFNYEFTSGVNAGKMYKGSLLWHRMAAYSKVVVSALNCASDDFFKELELTKNEQFVPKKVVSYFEHIAFLNHVKCSPLGDRSIPNTKMWENCGQHILIDELKILDPDYIIVLGSSANFDYLKNNVLGLENVESDVFGKIKYFKCKVFSKPTKVIGLPHPSAPNGGSSKSLYQSLFTVVNILKRH